MHKTAYELRISDWSSDVCSSDLLVAGGGAQEIAQRPALAAAVEVRKQPVERVLGQPLVVGAHEGRPVVAGVQLRRIEIDLELDLRLDEGDRKSTRLNSSH